MLKDKLQKLIDQSAGKISPEIKTIIVDSMQQVRDSIPARRIPKAGESIPEFELPNSHGALVKSNDLIGAGHLVVSFFRGGW